MALPPINPSRLLNMQICPDIHHLGFKRPSELELPGEARILNLEKQLGASLPEDYRAFLLRYGGSTAVLEVSVTEPSPKGDTHLVSSFTTLTDDPESCDDIRYYFSSYIMPRNVIYIASGDGDHGTCLSFAGIDKGSVYYLDEGQLAFADESHGLSDMPTVKEFLRLRDSGELGPKPPGYENLYHIADSFTEFIGKCKVSA
jgi:hypothetical protein